MKRRAFIATCIGGTLLLTGCGGGSNAPSTPTGAEQRAAEELTRSVRTKYGFPALGVAVIKSDGSPTVLIVDGVRQVGSPEHVTPEDRWHIGSCAKAMTAVLLARLVSEGKLSWTASPPT
jgi:CubicO group peptidase (beta-lactamase class C family)